MNKLLFFTVLAIVFCSCGESKLKNKVDYEVKIDKIDSTSYRELTDFKVKQMSSNIIGLDESTDFKFYFSGLQKVDSLKSNQAYDSYLKSIKNGEVADAGAYQVKTLFKSKTERYELWKLQYVSVDASPNFYGSHVFLSYFRNDSLKNTYEVANSSTAGRSSNSTITKANAHIKSDSVLVSLVKITKMADKSDTAKIDKIIMVK
ncbi:hypothetical protein [Lacihabitans soyangensis]|uniref:Lipoprotein n=1 Tax=Lacihabitans soyangensis TaxID=869394 RepID=A0AAE3GYC0_9BACT|nr:hypothetical protein [Lacihabitans soyangensis]MCP9761539.1 hypothetical protein [Lacihabitans soyangensis]